MTSVNMPLHVCRLSALWIRNYSNFMLCPLLSPPTPKIPSLPTTHPQIYWKDLLLEEDSQEAFPLANDLSSCSLSSLRKDPVSHGLWRRLFLLILEFFFHHALSIRHQPLLTYWVINNRALGAIPLKWHKPHLLPLSVPAPSISILSTSELSTLTVANWVLPLALQPLSFGSVQSLSRVGLCDPINCSTPGLPVHHQLPESTQTHVHWVGDAISSPP